ncbi:tetratricopeptide repeat protein [Streptomyces malaysiensis subsp. malaysiensis]|uniref:AfsR/SARP family transcriptional regulator n=1 Tax=Streptomyces malaysiensis TaxID=92644 RepID=UPI000BFE6904|nr:tetratricopeptide repeat protein [Streptomyces malaysiensis]ATL84277.1 transcriptional regulator, SARP family [Streptomyces malaysiensis]QDL71764.1 tetratricopeptide repeat protein [Streptomyces malaysiensis]
MDIHLLGPVELRLEGRQLKLGSDKERTLLAALALEVGRPVSMNALMDRLWDGKALPRARENAHTYISRVRKHLRLAGTGPSAPRITSRAHTYVLETDPDSVDLNRFQRLTDLAGAAATSGDDERVVDLLARAEDLWQGEALAGLPGTWAETVRATLAERRLHATISRIAALHRLGRFADSIGELSAMVRQRPEDETVAGQLMLAYYGSGRYTDALRVHQQARQLLMSEFGSRPGAELDRIHRGVLDRKPVDGLVRTAAAGASSEPSPGGSSADQPPPRNLPYQPPLIGRRSELDALMASIGAEPGGGAVLTVETVSGMAGVGKTAVAVDTARTLAPRFPAGQVFLDLHGHSPSQEPLSPDAALARLLRLFGAPADTIPVRLDELIALWRTTIADRRAVIVLDDAAGPDQVTPLLPGNSPTLTIVTSRRHLTGLPHAVPLALDVLPTDDAITLFRSFAGAARTQDITETTRIVRLCGHLPLAIELVANRFRSRPSWTLTTLGERLARSPGPLGEIRNADQEILRAFSLSYRALDTAQRTTFRRLGLHPGPDFTAESAAVLLDLPAEETERLIESLLECHLLREPVPDRYRYHDLLGDYARMLAFSEDEEREREEALARLITFSLRAAEHADRMAYPRRIRLATDGTDQLPALPRMRNADEARAWFTAERGNLLAAERHARTHGSPESAARLAHALAGFLEAECHWPEAADILQHAADHWSRTADQPALCHSLLCLSSNHANTGRYAQAVEAGERALEIARATGDREAEWEAYRSLGIIHWHQGGYEASVTLHQKALAIGVMTGNVWNEARSRNNIAISLLDLGEPERALDHFRTALFGFRSAGDQSGVIRTLNNLGDLYSRRGDHIQARKAFEELLPLTESAGNPYTQATVRTNLAASLAKTGEAGRALALHQQALTEFRLLGDRKSQATAHNGLGEAHLEEGSADASADHHQKALDIARDIGATPEITRALRGLGRIELNGGRLDSATRHLEASIATAHKANARDDEARAQALLAEVRLATGDVTQARELLQRALSVLRPLDASEAERISSRLAGFGGGTANLTTGE